MEERASCQTEDPTRLVLQGQGLTVDLSCQSRRGLSKKSTRNRNHTTMGKIRNMPYDRPGLRIATQKHHIGTLETILNRHLRWNLCSPILAGVKFGRRKK